LAKMVDFKFQDILVNDILALFYEPFKPQSPQQDMQPADSNLTQTEKSSSSTEISQNHYGCKTLENLSCAEQFFFYFLVVHHELVIYQTKTYNSKNSISEENDEYKWMNLCFQELAKEHSCIEELKKIPLKPNENDSFIKLFSYFQTIESRTNTNMAPFLNVTKNDFKKQNKDYFYFLMSHFENMVEDRFLYLADPSVEARMYAQLNQIKKYDLWSYLDGVRIIKSLSRLKNISNNHNTVFKYFNFFDPRIKSLMDSINSEDVVRYLEQNHYNGYNHDILVLHSFGFLSRLTKRDREKILEKFNNYPTEKSTFQQCIDAYPLADIK
jgi:hypothetical protein